MNNFCDNLKEQFIKLLDRFPTSDYHGLTNQGATCYLNSVLQVLFLTKDFREAVGCGGQDSTTIDSHLERLFASLGRCTADTHCIAKILGITEVYEQHDVAEYFEKILDLSSPEASQMFKGCLRYRTTCSSCQNQSDLDALFWTLPLSMEDPGHQTYSVKKGFEAFFMPSEVSGDNKIYCDKCRAKADATIECNMTRHPEILTLLLKRFEFDYETMCYVKLTCCVDVPQTLQTESCTYDLYALVDHIGSLKGGHYTAMIKSYQTGEWYRFDDAYVTMVRPSVFNSTRNATRSHNAYLLMYQKVKSPHSEIINGANQEAHLVNPDAVTVGTHDLTEGGEDCIPRTHLKDDVPDGYRDMRQVGSCGEVLPHRDNVTVGSCGEVLPHRDNVTVRSCGEVLPHRDNVTVGSCGEVLPHRGTLMAGVAHKQEKGLSLKGQNYKGEEGYHVQRIIEDVLRTMAVDVEMSRKAYVAQPDKEQINRKKHQKAGESKRHQYDTSSEEHDYHSNVTGAALEPYEKHPSESLGHHHPRKNTLQPSMAGKRQNGEVVKNGKMYHAERNLTDGSFTRNDHVKPGENNLENKKEDKPEPITKDIDVSQGRVSDVSLHVGGINTVSSSLSSYMFSLWTKDAENLEQKPLRDSANVRSGPTSVLGCSTDRTKNVRRGQNVGSLRKKKNEDGVKEQRQPWR